MDYAFAKFPGSADSYPVEVKQREGWCHRFMQHQHNPINYAFYATATPSTEPARVNGSLSGKLTHGMVHRMTLRLGVGKEV